MEISLTLSPGLHKMAITLVATLVSFLTYCTFFGFRSGFTAGFLIYVTDSFGYLATVGVSFIKEFMKVKITWSAFYSKGMVLFSVLDKAGASLSLLYFSNKFKKNCSRHG